MQRSIAGAGSVAAIVCWAVGEAAATVVAATVTVAVLSASAKAGDSTGVARFRLQAAKSQAQMAKTMNNRNMGGIILGDALPYNAALGRLRYTLSHHL